MTQINNKRLAALSRRLAIALGAGVDVRTALAREAERAPAGHRPHFDDLAAAVASGHAVGDAIRQAGGYFPILFRELAMLGDQTGRLPEVFSRLAEHYEHQIRLKREFWQSITGPLIQLSVAIVVVGLLIWITGMIGNASGEGSYDILGWGLVGTRGLLLYIALVLAAGAAAYGLYRAMTSEAAWTGPVQRTLARIPVVGSALTNLALARFTWAAGMALETGMDVRRALAIGLKSTHSAAYIAAIEPVCARIDARSTIHEALAHGGLLTDELLDVVDVGELSGTLPETLLRQSDEYQDRARASMAAVAKLGGFAVWAVVALMIVSIIFSIALKYVGMIRELSGP